MTDPERIEAGGEVCPKRLWVMTVLSDDELLDGDATLPQGLQFHLSRCDSCRSLANGLQHVSDCLHGLARLEPGDEFAVRAHSRAFEALAGGARLTGRVEIPDDPESELGHTRGVRWTAYARYAAAAAIVFGMGIYVGSNYVHTGRQVVVQEQGDDAVRPSVQPDAVADPARGKLAGEMVAEEVAGPNPASNAGKERSVVEAAVADGARSPVRRPRVPQSPIEAAQIDDPDYVPRAFFLPDPSQRTLGAGPAIDTEHSGDSTTE